MGMKSLNCPNCGANIELDETREYGFCSCCGTKVVQDKIIIEHRGTVKLDYSEELSNLYQLARRAKSNKDFEYAQKYYEQILIKDPNSWEANFYSVYFQSANYKISGIVNSAKRITNSQKTVLTLIKTNINEVSEQRKAVETVKSDCISISNMMLNSAKDYYDVVEMKPGDSTSKNYVSIGNATRNLCNNLGNYIEKIFGEEFSDISVECWKNGINLQVRFVPVLQDKKSGANIIEKYSNKIKKYDSSYVKPGVNLGGCYVATAVYGSYDCPEVWTLRRYRDNQLAKTWYGRLFIHTYYAISPTLVKWFGDTQWFKNMWKPKLDSIVKELRKSGVENTPYEDKEW